MRIYIVAADVQDRDEYRDYTTLPPEKRSWLPTVRHDTEIKYGEHVSIMGVYGSRAQAEHRVNELAREGFTVFPIIECTVDANCWEYIGGYAE
ncbi:hypothetical protein [Bifidobacterium pseudocatenulatum]|uniref:hypothetical protein n=1 Tax=Bifidobacterium pseudocatenulatum TaxID=28026 RepID=UPI0034A46C6E